MTEVLIMNPIPNSYWVLSELLIAGEYPGDPNPIIRPSSLEKLKSAGIQIFVDLTERGELNPYEDWLGDALHYRFPIRDAGTPSKAQMIKILDLIDEQVEQKKCTYVHCWGGIGRTGTVVGCWLNRHGEGGEQGLYMLRSLWGSCYKSAFVNSPETTAQERFICQWKSGE